MIKVLERIRLEGTYFNIEKDICENTTAIHILRGEKLEAIPLKSGKIHGFPPFTLLFYLVLEVLLRAIIKGKEIERILTGKERSNYPYLQIMQYYTWETHKNPTRKLL